jgi:hypothetical protein
MRLLLIFEVYVAKVFLVVLDVVSFASLESCPNVLYLHHIRKIIGIYICGRRTFLVYLFITFARIIYARFIVIRYKYKLSTNIQERLLIGRRGCVQGEI